MIKTIKTGIIQQANTTDISSNKTRLAEKIKKLAKDGAGEMDQVDGV